MHTPHHTTPHHTTHHTPHNHTTHTTQVLRKTEDRYHSQQDVYEDLGGAVLDNAYNGFNSTLFAYGQTGSGKSYSMVGYGPNKGIVPLAFETLFKRINANEDEKIKYQVSSVVLFNMFTCTTGVGQLEQG